MSVFKKILEKLLSAINDKNRPLVLGAALVIIFLFDYFLIMYPLQIRNLIKLNPQIHTLSKDLKQVFTDKAKQKDYEKEVIVLRARMELVGDKILMKEEIPAALESISRIANQTNMRITQMMPLKDSQELVFATDDGSYYSLPILVNARGGYHDVGRFFNGIERDKIFMSIADFDVTAMSDDPLRHSLKVTVKAFVLDKSEVPVVKSEAKDTKKKWKKKRKDK